ncbi:hypothetical protein ABB37_04284 [Leptomonas pyrrhocoris]|uniref:Uncharacterized protein n=1 Tax=Leptomonas pyrrhocoris TaxID=157538 RepID=A0A0N0DVU8_LEPPY|nr:hypothetical protein ABB37_04284 [Leptomonas pyrrhocoris]KPA80872.1 hypothetical protein ABB37_04284 [Leptomonas pyrrhocoris]|eukprot:XP_015659311.1 hypothetical protein ABB37_04284 [Leptomonas pyrrhocoris]
MMQGTPNNGNYPSSQRSPVYRARGGYGSATDLSSVGTPNHTFAAQHPPTPPLVFTTQFGGTPPHQQDPLATSPFVEPLQVNYQAVLGRRNSSTLVELEDSPITVTCRTKGTGRSPYVAPIQGEIPSEGERVGRHNPYTFSFSGNTSPAQVSTPTQGLAPNNFNGGLYLGPVVMDQHTADAYLTHGHSKRLDTQFELPPEVVHRSLKDRCRYIQFPANLPANPKSGAQAGGNPTSGNAGSQGNSGSMGTGAGAGSAESSLPIALFIGQVRFETTSAELLWLIHRTCGACASHLESRGAGCYLLYCRSEADLTLVRSLHKRILFDVGGVWLARTADEVDALCEYVALDAAVLSKKSRLPRDSMVVEELKADALNSNGSRRGHGGNPNTNNTPATSAAAAGGAGNHDKRSGSNHTFNNNNLRGRTGGGSQPNSSRRDGASPNPEHYQQQCPSPSSPPMQQLPQQQQPLGALPPYPGYQLSPKSPFGERPQYW